MFTAFVYGTLMTGGTAHELIRRYVRDVSSGRVRGVLVQSGEYPVLIPGSEGTVSGEWLTLEDEALPVMDEWEEYYGPNCRDNGYERIRIEDAYEQRSGWVYVIRDPEMKGT